MFGLVISTSLKFRFLLVAIAAALLVFGSQQVRNMPIDAFPEFAPPKVEVQTEGPGMTAEEVEELLTIPMEDSLRAAPNIASIRSSSGDGLSVITLTFKRGSDLLEARQHVQELVAAAIRGMPTWAGTGAPWITAPLSSTSRIMKIGFTSKDLDLMDLSMLAYWTIRFRLLAVPGVANIPVWGDRIKAFQVRVDQDAMRAHNITLQEVMATTGDAFDFSLLMTSVNAKTRIDGMIETPNQRLIINQELPIISPEDLAKVPLQKARPGASPPPRLGDIADVGWGTWPMVGDAFIVDQPGVMFIVEKLPWANTLEVTRGIEAALDEMRPGLSNIEINADIFRPATFIELSINNLTIALVIGAILVMLVLGAFLYEWRVALISVVSIPLSLVAAILVLFVLGTTINTMILAGFVVALGSVVDDAVIDVENIVRRLRQHRKAGSEKSTARIILDASLEVRPAILHATIIIVLALTPVFVMGGLSGAFFEPLALAFMLAMLASMVVATTVTPALCFILLDRADIEKRESPLVPWLKRYYGAVLSRAVKSPRVTFTSAIAVVALGVAIWPLLGAGLLPNFKERDFLIHWVPAPGTSRQEAMRITEQSAREFRAIPGVANFGAHIGRAVAGDEPMAVSFGENWLSLDPKANYDETVEAVKETTLGYAGLRRDVKTYLRERIKEVLTGRGDAIVVRLFGPELSVLRRTAADVGRRLDGIPGLIELNVEQQQEIPQIQIKLDLEAANQHGLSPGDIRRDVAVLMAGTEVSDTSVLGKVNDVWVWAPKSARNSLEDLRQWTMQTPFGGRVRLQDVADIRIVPTPNSIKRENSSRRIDVFANVEGRDLGSVTEDVAERLAAMEFPIGYHAELLGEFAERQAASQNLLYFSIFVAIAILLVLQASFRNWWLAGLIFLALPAAVVGSLIASFAGDRIVSLGSMVGIITVLGIAARNGILLIQHYRHLEEEEGEPFGFDLIMRGAMERLSPILMTTLATALALIPLVVAGSVPGNEIEHPMAVVILGGLITSTLVILFVVPILYLRVGSRKGKTVEDDFRTQGVAGAS